MVVHKNAHILRDTTRLNSLLLQWCKMSIFSKWMVCKTYDFCSKLATEESGGRGYYFKQENDELGIEELIDKLMFGFEIEISVSRSFGNLRFLVLEFLNMLKKRHALDLYFFSRKLFPLIRCIYQKVVNHISVNLIVFKQLPLWSLQFYF